MLPLGGTVSGEPGGALSEDACPGCVGECVVVERGQDLAPLRHRSLAFRGASAAVLASSAVVSSPSLEEGSHQVPKRSTSCSGVAPRMPGPLVRWGGSGITSTL